MASAFTRWSVARKIGAVGGVVGALLTCDYVLTNYPRGKREFRRDSVEGTLMEALNTGDIMLFTRNNKEFHPLKLLSLYFAKRQGEFDHVGVIIRSDQEELPYVLEYTFKGPKMTPFDQRVLCGSETDMSIRHVHLPSATENTKRKDLESWAEGVMQKRDNIGYLKLLSQQLRSAWNNHLSRPATLAQVRLLEARLVDEKDEARRQALQNLRRMATNSWNSLKMQPVESRGSPAAELVATAMQQLSVLPLNPSSADYVPSDFASDIPCEPNTFGPDLVAVIQKGRPRPKYDRPW